MIRSRMLLPLLMMSVMVTTSMAQESKAPAVLPRFSIVAIGDFDAEWVQALAVYVKDSLGVAATSRLVTDVEEPQGPAIAKELLGRFPAADENELRLFLVDAPRLVDEPAINLLFAQRAAVINAAAWTPAPVDHIALDVWRARVDRQFVFAGGRLLGMPACALPLCALHDDISAAGTEIKARGLCPPCSDRLREKLGLPAVVPVDQP